MKQQLKSSESEVHRCVPCKKMSLPLERVMEAKYNRVENKGW